MPRPFVVLTLSIVLTLSALGFATVTPAHASASNEAAASAEECLQLVKLLKADSLGIQMGMAMGNAIVDGMRSQWPDVPDTVMAIAHDEIRRIMVEGMKELMPEMLAVYSKYYTSSDVKALVAFYSSPVGQKVIRVSPALVQESMQKGQAWGLAQQQVITERVTKRIEAWKQGLPADPPRKD